jgi:4-hydroxy-3-polyprenylbenzoate decarboxylase
MNRYVMAITGASGPALGVKVTQELLGSSEVHLIVSSTAFSILRDEAGIDWEGKNRGETEKKIRSFYKTERLCYWAEGDFMAPVSSGSFRTSGMLVVPCSMKTLAGIAAGYAQNLVLRAADVTLKEGRPLLLSPREMPFSALHLENMLKLARLGVRMAPPVPAFYHRPGSLDDMIDFLAGKVLDAMGLEHGLFRRWEGGKPAG